MFQTLSDIISREVAVLFVAALPIIELRGAIPIGISLGLSPFHSMIISLIGSTMPAPFILFAVRPVFSRLRQTRTFRSLVHKLTGNSITKSKNIKKYGALGLLLFVAIPLPGTGVWSGSLAAALLDMRFKYAFPAILIGNTIAGMLIMALSYGLINVFIGV